MKRVSLNHWYVKDNRLEISLMWFFVSIDVKSNGCFLKVVEDGINETSFYFSNLEEAIEHINRYNTKHSEAIITKDYANARKFLEEVDAAAVYVNASTRFTDGFEFGFGAEIGISTQKLHARGPMGLKELTTTKYIIYGNGQVRP